MRTIVRSVIFVLAAMSLVACVAPADFDDGGLIRTVSVKAADITAKSVYFATTRCTDKEGVADPDTPDGLFAKRCWEAALKNKDMARLGFGMADGGGVTCGTASVTVAGFDGDTKALSNVDVPVSYDCTGSHEKLRQAVLATPCKCALIFVHGYNTTFGFGIKRTAQLALDLGYPGLPIMFSFGASGRFSDYINDTEAAELSAVALEKLLSTLSREEAGVRPKIDVIAHSMGARTTLRAVNEWGSPALLHLILAAPDIDQAAFLRLAGKAVKHAERLTLYTSRYDVAMSASQSTHAGYTRAGAGVSAGVASQLGGAEIIDATERATDPYAHSYFAESAPVLNDIREVLNGRPAAKRKPLVCKGEAPAVVVCALPCPEGAKCGPNLYARFVHWLLD